MTKSAFKFRTSLRVRWSECDAQRITYNAAYMDYLEVGQTEYYRNLGFSLYRTAERGHFDTATVKAVLEYKSPARLDDIVDIFVRIAKVGNTSITTEYEIYRHDSDLILLQAQMINVGYDANLSVTKKVPTDIRTLISRFEETGEVLPINAFPNLVD